MALDAVDPGDGKYFDVFVSPARISQVMKLGEHAVQEMAYVVSEVLRKPTGIYEGIRWDDDTDRFSSCDEWRCYVGIPTVAFRHPGSSDPTSPPPGMVFLVFVNQERIAYNWRWERADEMNPDQPITEKEGSKPRFRKKMI